MNNRFFEKPIINSPYEYPMRHWELDESGQPMQEIIERRRSAEFITQNLIHTGAYRRYAPVHAIVPPDTAFALHQVA